MKFTIHDPEVGDVVVEGDDPREVAEEYAKQIYFQEAEYAEFDFDITDESGVKYMVFVEVDADPVFDVVVAKKRG